MPSTSNTYLRKAFIHQCFKPFILNAHCSSMQSNHRYFIVYKPFQVLTQFTAADGKLCLKDHFQVPKDVYPVGRLDYDSEGLLILTNDASLNERLLHPKHRHERTYYVQVEGNFTEEAKRQLEKGVSISINGKPHQTLPAQVKLFDAPPSLPERNPPIRFRKNVPDSWIAITLKEGKNRQVRKMTAAVGFPTLRLVRFSIGKLTLDNMQPGELVEMNPKELYDLLFEGKAGKRK